MKPLAIALFFSAAIASGQKLELGFTAGLGAFGAEDVSYRKFAVVGAEACVFCSGTFALFGEYNHWENQGAGAVRITGADLGAVGLRIQRESRVRPFFDWGLAFGQDRFVHPAGGGSHNIAGTVLGAGLTLDLGERWYVRPQYRGYLLQGPHVAMSASVGVGYRF